MVLIDHKIGFEHKFDTILTISVKSLRESHIWTDIANHEYESDERSVAHLVDYLLPILRTTVGQRVIQLEAINLKDNNKYLTFGLVIDSEKAYNNVERGPNADSPEAKHFKEFWGQKSELRRFQDLNICETVYWKTKCFAEQRKIIDQSIQYILTTNVGIGSDFIAFSTSLLDPMLERRLKFHNKETVYGTGEEFCLLLSQQLEELAKQLRNLNGLPLAITSVQGIDAVFRGTEVFPAIASNSGMSSKQSQNCNLFDINVDKRVVKYFKPMEIVIDMEGSGKWPNSLDAFLRVKASFYLEMSRNLMKQFDLLCRPTPHHLDIYKNGFIFRVIIGSHKEILLRRQVTTKEGMIKQILSPEADHLETKFEVTTKLNSALSALNRTHRCYGIASRLAKRWIASQMMSYYFDDMAIDLLMAYIFVKPQPYTVPNTPIVAFLRFLSLISDNNWKTHPIIVDLSGTSDTEKVTQIVNDFEKKRSDYPHMFVTTTYDKQWSHWTRQWPDLTILKRLKHLAFTARQVLSQHIQNPFKRNSEIIFRPDLEVFDIIIHLRSDQIARNETSDKTFIIKPLDESKSQRMPIIGFDPIQQYLEQLVQCYSRFALFFNDCFGGHHIGVVLKPSSFESQVFNQNLVTVSQLSSTADQNGRQNIDINIKAMIEDFEILGEGIVDKVEVKAQQWTQR